MFYRILILFILAAISPCLSTQVSASQNEQQILKNRMELYKRVEDSTQLPWYYIAAFDQYERSIRLSRKDLPPPNTLGILIPADKWSGLTNPNKEDTNPFTISFFGGIGMDGDQDGKADRSNDYDQLASINHYLLSFGADKDNFRIGIWEYYKRDRAVSIIMGNAKLFKKHQTIDLQKRHFLFRLAAIIHITALGELPEAGVVAEHMKERISSLIMGYPSDLLVMGLSN